MSVCGTAPARSTHVTRNDWSPLLPSNQRIPTVRRTTAPHVGATLSGLIVVAAERKKLAEVEWSAAPVEAMIGEPPLKLAVPRAQHSRRQNAPPRARLSVRLTQSKRHTLSAQILFVTFLTLAGFAVALFGMYTLVPVVLSKDGARAKGVS